MKLLKELPDSLRKTAARDVPRASEDKLDKIRAKVMEARELELEIENVTRRVQELSEQLRRLRTEDLPRMFEENGVPSITIAATGNMPAFTAELQPFYHANIPDPEKDPQGYAAGMAWLKRNKLEDFIKTQVKVDYGRGQRKLAAALEKLLKKQKVGFASKQGVPWNTLTAEVRRRYESGNPLSPADLTAIGGTVGTVVKISKMKEKK